MINKNIYWGIGAVIVVIIGGIIFWQMQAGNNSPAQTQNTNTDTTTVTTEPEPNNNQQKPGTYTAAQVATHNSASSCWTIIDAKVYDLTKWIPLHPGGQEAIKGLCGKDGTAAFHGQHDDAKQQADILATFKIGDLAQ